ncbi:MAG: O-antigen ligase family protein [Pyrinomonadaceae bacterium]
MRDSRWFIAILWPVVLTVPYFPGIPRPFLGGLAWRQELTFAILLVVTSAFLIREQRNSITTKALSLRSSSLLISAGLFALWIAASTLWASNPYSAAHYAFTWGAYLLFFLLMRIVAGSPRALRASFYALGFVVWLLSVSCLIEWLGGAALTDHSVRTTVKPLFRGFSGFSEVMAVTIPIFGALCLTSKKSRVATLCAATALVAWLVTLQAAQRAPILGAGAGLLLLGIGILVLRECRPRSLRRAGLLLSGLVLVAVAQLAVFAPMKGEKSTAFNRLQTTSLSEANTRIRLLYWGVGWEMFRAHPLLGVGANNYEAAFPAAREQFSARHSRSALVGMNEQLLTQYAHNEYVQILAELGLIGFLLFSVFCVLLTRTLWQALRRARRPLAALGAGAGLLAFAVSSAASAFSFRWFGSGLVFFFAAAIVSHCAEIGRESPQLAEKAAPTFGRLASAAALSFAILMFFGASTQATNSVLHAWAQSSNSPTQAENLYRHALRFNRFDASSHFDYGFLLYQQKRYPEAIHHLRYAVANGLNTSTHYAVLAAAQAEDGDLAASEQTLADASRAYPRSVFILVRHGAALAPIGRGDEAGRKVADALKIHERSARGWYQLINFDIDAALDAAKKDLNIPIPGELEPQTAVFVVIKENERRLNIPTNTGWRGRIRTAAN